MNLEKVIIGTALGDTLGLPMEGMKPSKIAKLGWTESLRQRFFFGKGMWSDDTDHTLHLIDALTLSDGDPERFRKAFSKRLIFWLSTLPPGVGLATLKSIIKQLLGFRKTGIFSAGNGPAMRAAVVGAIYPDDEKKRKTITRIHTELTHSDPKALEAAEIVAEIAATFARGEINLSLDEFTKEHSPEWKQLIKAAQEAVAQKSTIDDVLRSMKIRPEKGVSGYSYHTVPAVVYVGIKNDWDFQRTVAETIALGGDADSTAAIVGALCALHPNAEIPLEWQDFSEFPISLENIKKVCRKLEKKESALFVNTSLWVLYLTRNFTQLIIIFGHLATRLFPAGLVKKLIK